MPVWEQPWEPEEKSKAELERIKKYEEFEQKQSQRFPGTTVPDTGIDDIDQDIRLNNGENAPEFLPSWVEPITPEKQKEMDELDEKMKLTTKHGADKVAEDNVGERYGEYGPENYEAFLAKALHPEKLSEEEKKHEMW